MILSRKIGIDLGTSTVRMYVKGEGIVVNEPAGSPLDRDSTKTLHQLIGKAKGVRRFFKPEVIVSVPSAVTSSQRRAFTEAAISAGARQVWLIDEPLAAAMGAGLPIGDVHGLRDLCDRRRHNGGRRDLPVGHGRRPFHPRRRRSSDRGDRGLCQASPQPQRSRARPPRTLKIAVGSARAHGQSHWCHRTDGVQISSNDIAEALQEPLRLIAGDDPGDARRDTAPRSRPTSRERGSCSPAAPRSCRGLAEFITHADRDSGDGRATIRRLRSYGAPGSPWTTSRSSGAIRATSGRWDLRPPLPAAGPPN